MNQPEIKPIDSTRRDLLKGAGVLLGATLIGCEGGSGVGPEAQSNLGSRVSGRKRIAVIGGGAGGIASAYFLSPDHDVDLFESNSKVGGHCDSRTVVYKGKTIQVDLGAQFFHPDTHPIYVSLLEELGLYLPENTGADETIEAPGSITVFKKGVSWPTFASNYAWMTPFFAVDFLIYAQYARAVITQNQSWEMTLEEWITKLPVSRNFKDSLLYPWISALIGTNIIDSKRSSARSILQTFALAFPSDIFKGASTYNSNLGLEGNLRRMIDRSPPANILVNAAVTGLANENGQWTVHTAGGSHGPYHDVIFNAPPRITKELLAPLASAADIVAALSQYDYFDARMVIHTDAKYMHRDRYLWAAYNGMVEAGVCEGSVWYGGIHPKLPSGETLDVFKSWAQRRTSDPSNILFERRFKHPLITPKSIRAARSLSGFQGRDGLHFAGQHTLGFDLQEAAVYSAMKVADRLAPTSATLTALRARMASRGRSNINYDL